MYKKVLKHAFLLSRIQLFKNLGNTKILGCLEQKHVVNYNIVGSHELLLKNHVPPVLKLLLKQHYSTQIGPVPLLTTLEAHVKGSERGKGKSTSGMKTT